MARLWQQPARQLPICVPPVPDETVFSYLARLATANHISPKPLVGQIAELKQPHHWPGSDDARLNPLARQRLAMVTGQPLIRLERVLPALRLKPLPHTPTPTMRRLSSSHPRFGPIVSCPQCMARRGITARVHVHLRAERYVCTRHELWLRGRQPHTDQAPEIVRTQHRHRRLVSRLGRRCVRRAHYHAEQIVMSWLQEGWHRELHPGWNRRLDALGVKGATLYSVYDWDLLEAATYPETIALTSMLAAPYWDTHLWERHGRAQRPRLLTEVGRRLGISVTGRADPLVRWLCDVLPAARHFESFRTRQPSLFPPYRSLPESLVVAERRARARALGL